jgi:hypothetical protein
VAASSSAGVCSRSTKCETWSIFNTIVAFLRPLPACHRSSGQTLLTARERAATNLEGRACCDGSASAEDFAVLPFHEGAE